MGASCFEFVERGRRRNYNRSIRSLSNVGQPKPNLLSQQKNTSFPFLLFSLVFTFIMAFTLGNIIDKGLVLIDSPTFVSLSCVLPFEWLRIVRGGFLQPLLADFFPLHFTPEGSSSVLISSLLVSLYCLCAWVCSRVILFSIRLSVTSVAFDGAVVLRYSATCSSPTRIMWVGSSV